MNVNSIRSNQNFGNEFHISPEAADALKECSIEELNKIREIGDQIRKLEYADMKLDKFLEPTVINNAKNVSAREFYEPVQVSNNTLKVMTRPARSIQGYEHLRPIGVLLPFATNNEAWEALKSLSNKNGLDAALEYAKLVEKSEQYLASVNESQSKMSNDTEILTQKLITDFMA